EAPTAARGPAATPREARAELVAEPAVADGEPRRAGALARAFEHELHVTAVAGPRARVPPRPRLRVPGSPSVTDGSAPPVERDRRPRDHGAPTQAHVGK